jgi:hypothetical protein
MPEGFGGNSSNKLVEPPSRRRTLRCCRLARSAGDEPETLGGGYMNALPVAGGVHVVSTLKTPPTDHWVQPSAS